MENITAQAPYFMIVFTRVGAFVAFVPFFSNKNYIKFVKVGFAFFVSLLLFPTMPIHQWVVPNDMLSFIWMMTGEVLVGLLMGFVFFILLFALQLAGRMLGFQMAFSMANVADPTFGENAGVLSVMMLMVGSMILVAMGGDHYLLFSLKQSFQVLAPGGFAVTRSLLDQLNGMILHSFEIGFRLAAPAIVLLLCIDLTLGLIGKTASKMQIFFVGLPLKISIGLFGFSLILGFVDSLWAKDILKLPETLLGLFQLMRV